MMIPPFERSFLPLYLMRGRTIPLAFRERRKIVFIDESGLSARPHRVRTWAPQGQTGAAIHFHSKTLSAIADCRTLQLFLTDSRQPVRRPSAGTGRKARGIVPKSKFCSCSPPVGPVGRASDSFLPLGVLRRPEILRKCLFIPVPGIDTLLAHQLSNAAS
jgi:hypothetical protein